MFYWTTHMHRTAIWHVIMKQKCSDLSCKQKRKSGEWECDYAKATQSKSSTHSYLEFRNHHQINNHRHPQTGNPLHVQWDVITFSQQMITNYANASQKWGHYHSSVQQNIETNRQIMATSLYSISKPSAEKFINYQITKSYDNESR